MTRRAAAAGLTAIGLGAASPAAPRRVVSLNPCLDVILVHVADRGQIAALSHYAREAYGSTIAKVARTLPYTFESAEEVIALSPDMVLSGRHSSLATRQALKRLGVRTELFGVPDTLDESLQQVRRIAALVRRPERGEAVVRRIEDALRRAAPPRNQRPVSALVFMPGGFASAPGTLMDEMMRRAGLENAAARYGLKRSMNVPLERLIADPPELLLAGEAYPGAPSWAERVMEHPALTRIAGRMHRAVFPERLLFCGGPVLIDSAAALAKARRDAVARRG
ncbi:MAG: ABC transporter substrate-binding protein [Proteobacteria bacterium]|nr:ABC transporter substrate-binding protein [Pseudomonadota bacterium]